MFRIVCAAALAFTGTAFAQDMTNAEMTTQAQANVEVIEKNADRVEEIVATAKKSDKSDAVACVAPKAVSANALKTVSQNAFGKMEDAMANDDSAGAKHQFGVIDVAAGRSNTIVGDAGECIGEGGGGKGSGSTSVTGAPRDDETDDTTDNDEIREEDVAFDAPPVSATGG